MLGMRYVLEDADCLRLMYPNAQDTKATVSVQTFDTILGETIRTPACSETMLKRKTFGRERLAVSMLGSR